MKTKKTMRTQRPGLMGQLSRILMVMSGPAANAPQATGPAPHRGISLTNRCPSPHGHRLDFPRRDIRSRQDRSLCNSLSKGPLARRDLPPPQTGGLSVDGQQSRPVPEIERFYRVFLSGILERHPDVRGVRLHTEIRLALDEAREELPGEAGALIPDLSTLLEPGRPADGPEKSPSRRGARGPNIETVRRAYLTVLQRILARLSPRLDSTVLKLVFRLAARTALRDGRELVDRYSLLEGIPDHYLRQVDR